MDFDSMQLATKPSLPSGVPEEVFSLWMERVAELTARKIMAHLETRKPQPEKLLFSIDETAYALNMSRSTIKTMIREQELSAVHRKGRTLIERKTILDWITRNRR